MTRQTWFTKTILVGIFLICAQTTWSRPVNGSATLKILKPATKDIIDQVQQNATSVFRVDLWEWMKEVAEVSVDTGNAIQRYHFYTYADSCIKKAKVESTVNGHSIMASISLSGEDARAILEAYNTQSYSMSLRCYTLMKKALEDSAVTELYSLGIQTIFYSMGRMGTPIDMPEESTPRSFLLEDTHKIMQNFFDKFAVRSQEVIITGKPGTMLISPLSVQTYANTRPLADIVLVGILPGGKEICSGKSASDGAILFNNFKIPFVAKGTMLYFKPDVSAPVNNVTQFQASDLRLTIPEQSLVFNTVPAMYKLTYAATAANAVTIPKDFASDVFIKKFLKDSCYLIIAPAGQKPDLVISLTNQISSYSSDETEKTTRKVESKVLIKDADDKTLTEKQVTTFEKSYDNLIPLPEGMFFWDAASKTTQMLRAIISNL